jgi:hypothetical protein
MLPIKSTYIMKTINKAFASITKKVLNIDDYYTVGFTKREMSFQGKFNSELLARLKRIEDNDTLDDISINVLANGYIGIHFKYEGFLVEITLT